MNIVLKKFSSEKRYETQVRNMTLILAFDDPRIPCYFFSLLLRERWCT